tara:strand:- start:1683 stop:2078 length:396 start_codon:yes stop_codon:yes gene_type:complete
MNVAPIFLFLWVVLVVSGYIVMVNTNIYKNLTNQTNRIPWMVFFNLLIIIGSRSKDTYKNMDTSEYLKICFNTIVIQLPGFLLTSILLGYLNTNILRDKLVLGGLNILILFLIIKIVKKFKIKNLLIEHNN